MNPDPLAQNENNNNFPNPIALTPDSAFQPAEEKSAGSRPVLLCPHPSK
ncbi:MAG: hypothetical protein HWD61_06080 [Parachlamydiaceae bacterium]|nr:MAG: hypothetical protein HWD61_06080 [Parachlamydiaceae bacterium]